MSELEKYTSFRETAKNVGYVILGLAFLGLLLLLAMGFIYGAVWVSAKLYPIAAGLSVIGLVILVLTLLPSTIFRGSRRFCGNGIVLVSYIWGISLWMYSILVLYQLLGPLGMFLGFAFLGFGSVPLACVALLFHGEWGTIGELILSVLLIFLIRILGYWVISKGEQPAEIYDD